MPQLNDATQVGKREDLSDTMIVADAKNTPLTSMMPKGKKPANVLYSWPHTKIPDPDTTPIPDGKPVDNVEDLSGQRALLQGRVQKLRRVIGVSEFAEDINTPAGIAGEYANSKANGIIAVKRAIEAVFASDQDSSLVGTTHSTRGLGKWIQSTAQSDLPVDANFRTPAGNIVAPVLTALTEDDIRGVMESIYQQTGEMLDHDLLAGTNLKKTISTMTVYTPNVSGKTVVRTFFADLPDNTLNERIDVIQGDFGTLRISPTLWNGYNNTTKLPDHKRGYILKMSGIKMRANKLPGHKPLPEDDSGPKGVISCIISMQVDSPLVHGKIAAT